MLKQLLFVALAFASSNLAAQKMNVLDYFKAFIDNTKSPNNQMISKWSPKLNVDNNSYYLTTVVGGKLEKNDLIVNQAKTYLTYKDFEGWKGGKCYPTFKVYTKANGEQILGVTEDSYTHHSYSSKYHLSAPTLDYSDCPNYDEQKNLLRRNRQLTTEERTQKTAELNKVAEKYVRDNDPYHQWNQRPKPIKFWTYASGNWTEVTDQVMTEFFSLEEMISKTNTSSEDIKERIIHHIYPLYRIEAEKDEITVWVDGERNKLYTTEIEEFANAADNLTNRQKNLPIYWDYVRNTTYKSYTLVWDAKAGKFVRKK